MKKQKTWKYVDGKEYYLGKKGHGDNKSDYYIQCPCVVPSSLYFA